VTTPTARQQERAPLPATVRVLALVSLLTDAASEMVYPLLPVFLTTVLGASPQLLGAIEGAAEATASLVKIASGWWGDRLQRYKPLVVIGYTIATLTRPLIGVATTAWHVVVLRLLDRTGKGIRTAPRDALIAGSVDAGERGRAFGFHRAGDHLGAVIGPLIAFVLLQSVGLSLRTVFVLSLIPGVLSVLVLMIGVREAAVAPNVVRKEAMRSVALPRSFWAMLGVIALFALGNSTDAFLLLRAQQLGVPVALLPVLWAVLHVVKSGASTYGGVLSDRFGRRRMIVLGWAWFALVYAGFAVADTTWHAWALFVCYGLFFAMTEGAEKALVADLAPAEARGTAFGWYNGAVGVAALPASLLCGWLWTRSGPQMAFGVGAALALTAAGLAMIVVPRRVAVAA
jgi:MFS family permease